MQQQPLDYRSPHDDTDRPVSPFEWALAAIVAVVFLSVFISLVWYLVTG